MDEQKRPEAHRLTAEEVGERVGAILGDAEREAREIIESARREGGAPATVTLDDLARALDRLATRLDAFELATAAQIEELGRRVADSIVATPAAQPSDAPGPRSQRHEDSPAIAAARVRATDLALAGYSREVIANELASSLDRAQVEALLDEVLLN